MFSCCDCVENFNVISFATITASDRSSDTIRYWKTICKVCAIAKIATRVKCGLRGAVCVEVPMCKVLGKVWFITHNLQT